MPRDYYGRVVPAIEEFYFAREKLYYYSDGTLKYKCGHTNADAAETATTWSVWKFVWTAGNMTDKEGPLNGAVNTEAAVNALAWNI